MKFDGPYCLTHQDGKTHYATGEIRKQRLLSEIPRRGRWPVFSMVPFSQLRERGFDVHDQGEEILSLVTSEYREIQLGDVLAGGVEPEIKTLGAPTVAMGDAEFEANVARLIKEEICRGEGSNFLLSRKGRIQFVDFDWKVANAIFKRLARNAMCRISANASGCERPIRPITWSVSNCQASESTIANADAAHCTSRGRNPSPTNLPGSAR